MSIISQPQFKTSMEYSPASILAGVHADALMALVDATKPGFIADGDCTPSIKKTYPINANTVIEDKDVVMVFNLHSVTILGYLFEKNGADFKFLQEVKSISNVVGFSKMRNVCVTLTIFSDTISTTNAVLSGRISCLALEEMPPVEDLTFDILPKYSMSPQCTRVNKSLAEGLVLTSRAESNIRYVDLDQKIIAEHQILSSGTVATNSVKTFNIPKMYQYGGIRLKIITHDLLQSSIKWEVDGQAGDGGALHWEAQTSISGPVIYDWTNGRHHKLEQVKITVALESAAVDVQLVCIDPVLGNDGKMKHIVIIQGNLGTKNINLFGNQSVQSVPHVSQYPQVQFEFPVAYSPYIYELWNVMFYFGKIHLVSTRSEFEEFMKWFYSISDEELIYLASGKAATFTSLLPLMRVVVEKLKKHGIKPADILRKGVSGLSKLANSGINYLESSGYASTGHCSGSQGADSDAEFPVGLITKYSTTACCSTDRRKRRMDSNVDQLRVALEDTQEQKPINVQIPISEIKFRPQNRFEKKKCESRNKKVNEMCEIAQKQREIDYKERKMIVEKMRKENDDLILQNIALHKQLDDAILRIQELEEQCDNQFDNFTNKLGKQTRIKNQLYEKKQRFKQTNSQLVLQNKQLKNEREQLIHDIAGMRYENTEMFNKFTELNVVANRLIYDVLWKLESAKTLFHEDPTNLENLIDAMSFVDQSISEINDELDEFGPPLHENKRTTGHASTSNNYENLTIKAVDFGDDAVFPTFDETGHSEIPQEFGLYMKKPDDDYKYCSQLGSTYSTPNDNFGHCSTAEIKRAPLDLGDGANPMELFSQPIADNEIEQKIQENKISKPVPVEKEDVKALRDQPKEVKEETKEAQNVPVETFMTEEELVENIRAAINWRKIGYALDPVNGKEDNASSFALFMIVREYVANNQKKAFSMPAMVKVAWNPSDGGKYNNYGRVKISTTWTPTKTDVNNTIAFFYTDPRLNTLMSWLTEHDRYLYIDFYYQINVAHMSVFKLDGCSWHAAFYAAMYARDPFFVWEGYNQVVAWESNLSGRKVVSYVTGWEDVSQIWNKMTSLKFLDGFTKMFLKYIGTVTLINFTAPALVSQFLERNEEKGYPLTIFGEYNSNAKNRMPDVFLCTSGAKGFNIFSHFAIQQLLSKGPKPTTSEQFDKFIKLALGDEKQDRTTLISQFRDSTADKLINKLENLAMQYYYQVSIQDRFKNSTNEKEKDKYNKAAVAAKSNLDAVKQIVDREAKAKANEEENSGRMKAAAKKKRDIRTIRTAALLGKQSQPKPVEKKKVISKTIGISDFGNYENIPYDESLVQYITAVRPTTYKQIAKMWKDSGRISSELYETIRNLKELKEVENKDDDSNVDTEMYDID